MQGGQPPPLGQGDLGSILPIWHVKLDERHHNLPIPLTSLVGRESEIAEGVRLLGSARLVTLVGMPGVGKTRLGLAIAATLIDSYPDGVWLTELAALSDPLLLSR